MKLKGRVALVTGAQQGIGAAIALALAGDGADVAVTWHDNEKAAESVAQGVRDNGCKAALFRADVSKLSDIEMMVAETARQLGTPDILVNNAGVYPRVPLLEMRESDWDFVLDINLKAGCFAAIAVAKALIAEKKTGSIINLSSQSVRGAVRGVHYSASKGGVVSMTRALALELAPHGIRVNAIAPGLTDTAQPRYGNSDPELIEMARQSIPLGGRMLTPDQIARTAVFLSSSDSCAMTGQVLHVNGGSYMP
ncbi:MAG: SDR family oxidoreductase [Enhydrobacter sp.]|nr:SDR family oxidoreductase [Enhydrobacter sp.]